MTVSCPLTVCRRMVVFQPVTGSILHPQDQYLLGCDAVKFGRHLLIFRRRVLPPFSESKNTLNSKQKTLLVVCLTYFSTPKEETVRCSVTSVSSNRLITFLERRQEPPIIVLRYRDYDSQQWHVEARISGPALWPFAGLFCAYVILTPGQ